MDLIIGGAYQGKLTLAAREYGLTPGDICDLAAGEPALGARCYTHLEELTRRPKAIGFLLPPMKKEELFPTVIHDGVLPRKTFSMGEAHDKRFYLEARRIRV